MKVKCFGCDASIEADGADDVVDAFVVHAQERHTWPYPEEAIAFSGNPDWASCYCLEPHVFDYLEILGVAIAQSPGKVDFTRTSLGFVLRF
jgi:hypothetical protein